MVGKMFKLKTIQGDTIRSIPKTKGTQDSELIREAVTQCVNDGTSLYNADLSGGNLRRIEFRAATLNIKLTNANCRGAMFTGTNPAGSMMLDSNIEGVDFTEATFENVMFPNTRKSNFSAAKFNKCSFDNARLMSLDASDARFENCRFVDTTIVGGSMMIAKFLNCAFASATLKDVGIAAATFQNCIIDATTFYHMLFDRTSFKGSHLCNTNLIDGGTRADGYRFIGYAYEGRLWITAGCRNFTYADADRHWRMTRPASPLGDETRAILQRIKQTAEVRRLIR